MDNPAAAQDVRAALGPARFGAGDTEQEEGHSSDNDAQVLVSSKRPGAGGRPPDQVVDQQAFTRKCEIQGPGAYSNADLMREFNLSIDAVKRCRRKWKLPSQHPTFLHQKERSVNASNLPGRDDLRKRWLCRSTPDEPSALYRHPVQSALQQLANEYLVSVKVLRRHMSQVSFDPIYPWTDQEVEAAIDEILSRPYVCNLGPTFLDSALRMDYHICARKTQIQRVYKKVAQPRPRGKGTYKKKKPYRVFGPRSLYHLDAHEKLAKVWGTSRVMSF